MFVLMCTFLLCFRRARRQDVKYGDPWSQCPITEDDSVEVKQIYGVEGNSTFLECWSRSGQAEVRWTLQQNQNTELSLTDDHRRLLLKRGLLLHRLDPTDAGVYSCSAHEQNYVQLQARYRLHVLPQHGLQTAWRLQPGLQPHRNSWANPLRSYKDLQMVDSLNVDQYCEQLWYREKRRQQKLRTLKLKQESKKARVRRNNPPERSEQEE
ncbi:semaphorin-3D-like [Acanthochromis polyacanthus]|uniref:semaphorin-3D-like n=1 Tax=Acanthochromis polyacanthus TaxID=80966 RepID=UPI0022346D3B|nr:semaphorin-3D-like [Acanthochromis polyacanthus]